MKDVVVAKFGGSSLADSTQFAKVKAIVEKDKNRRYVIPSAPGKRHGKDHKVTDYLYMCHQLASHGINFDEVFDILKNRYMDICRELELDLDLEELFDHIKFKIREGASKDYTASRGEYLNARILSNYLGYEFIDAREIILFDSKNEYDQEATEEKIRERLKDVEYAVIPGFYGQNTKGDIVTFSRGGSDITGAIVSNAVDASLYENWTDVSGFLMADPRIVKDPKPISTITYKELRELSFMGANVLHEEAIFPIKAKGIPINIKNTNAPEDMGTLIVSDHTPVKEAGTITGISGKKDYISITIEKTLMNQEVGMFRKVMSIFESNDIPIEHIPSGIDTISVVVPSANVNGKLHKIIEELNIYCKPDSIDYYSGMSIIAVVGRGMIKSKGISARIFTSLAKDGVNIRMITQGSSEMNIIIGVENEDFDTAINAIYQGFIK